MLLLRTLIIAFGVVLVIPACGSDSGDDTGTDTGTDTGSTGGTSVADIAALTGDATAGAEVYSGSCAFCHTETGDENGTTPALTARVSGLTPEVMIETVVNGSGGMPAFGSTLEPQQIADVVAYVEASFGG